MLGEVIHLQSRDLSSTFLSLIHPCLHPSQGLLSFLSAPLIGALSDVWGRKSFLLLTVFFTCAPIPLMKISPWWVENQQQMFLSVVFTSKMKCCPSRFQFWRVKTWKKVKLEPILFVFVSSQVVLCSHLHVRCFCRHLLCDICVRGRYHSGAWEEHSVRFGKLLIG